jgi:glycosyltransferase involved in cell wall biosynthesis
MMTKISVVTTSFNHDAFLEETLESVRSQSYAEVEHVVVDGRSMDGTLALLESKTGEEWKHLRWTSEPDGGQTQAMNKGLRLATGEIIGWLNSDDRYRPGCLEKVARAFADNPDVDVIYGDYTFIDERGAHLRVRREIEFSMLVLLYLGPPHIPTTSTFFRRRIFDEGNWLDESLQYAMDHEFFIRLATKGYRFKHLGAVLADFRLHPSSKTCSMAGSQISESRIATRRHSPVALRIKNEVIRSMCLGVLKVLAVLARYGEKAVRGYYLPERIGNYIRPIG